jgi:tetratricopeptide (TPR) repeat protein
VDPRQAGIWGNAWVRRGAAVGLALSTLALYAQVRGHAFLHYDDNMYVTENPVVLQGLTWQGFLWAWTSLDAFNWHPLTWLSHMLDVELFGLDAGAHHLVNAALHAANAAVLFVVLATMTGAAGPSLVVAALFAVHPMHVESVAWVSERKDLLSTLFGFAGLGAYARYARRPGAWRYAAVAISFAASLMAKPMWVTFPFLLLLLDFWPLGRVQRIGPASAPPPPGPGDRPTSSPSPEGAVLDVSDARIRPGESASPAGRGPAARRLPAFPLSRLLLEKLPLLALSAASSAITVLAQERGGAIRGLEIGFGARLANAAVSYVAYLARTAWPVGLSPQYPHAGSALPAWKAAAAALLLAAVTGLALAGARRMPWLAVGWLWFLGMLVPVIGLVQVGAQSMADRYSYVPLVGLFVAVAWGGAALVASRGLGPPLAVAASAAVVALAAATWRQVDHWATHESLFRHAVTVNPANGLAHHILSQGLAAAGKLDEALAHAREAVRLEPGLARVHKNLGYVLFRVGLVDESIASLRTAVALQPDYAEAYQNLAVAYARKGWAELANEARSRERALRAQGR